MSYYLTSAQEVKVFKTVPKDNVCLNRWKIWRNTGGSP